MSEKIAILVDSGTDVPESYVQKYSNIYFVSLRVIYPEGEYEDRIDITSDQIFARMPHEIPKTSLPDGGQIADTFHKIISDGYNKLLIITISSGLSGTFNTLRLASLDYPELETALIDTKNIGIGAGCQAAYAADLIAEGVPFSEIVTRLEHSVPLTHVFFCVNTLEYLMRGGRIGKVTGIVGTALNPKPVISCNEDGIYYTVAKSRGREKSLKKALELILNLSSTTERFNVGVAQAGAPEEAQKIVAILKEALPQAVHIFEGSISPALTVHTGPGLLGIFIQPLD